MMNPKGMSGTAIKTPSDYSPRVSSSMILTARSDLGLISIWNFEGILGQRVNNRSNAQDSLFFIPEVSVLVLYLWLDLLPVRVDCLGDVHCCKE